MPDGVASVRENVPSWTPPMSQRYQLSIWTLQLLVTFDSHLGVGLYKLGYLHHLCVPGESGRLETKTLLLRESK